MPCWRNRSVSQCLMWVDRHGARELERDGQIDGTAERWTKTRFVFCFGAVCGLLFIRSGFGASERASKQASKPTSERARKQAIKPAGKQASSGLKLKYFSNHHRPACSRNGINLDRLMTNRVSDLKTLKKKWGEPLSPA